MRGQGDAGMRGQGDALTRRRGDYVLMQILKSSCNYATPKILTFQILKSLNPHSAPESVIVSDYVNNT